MKAARYGYLWWTLGFFLLCIIGHWAFAWFAFVDEAETHREPVRVVAFLHQALRDTLENWQSEFLQLIWQVAGLAYLYYLGSPQSKDGDERLEAKVDALLSRLPDGPAIIHELDHKYPRH